VNYINDWQIIEQALCEGKHDVNGGHCDVGVQERLTTIERRMPAHNDDLRKRTTEFELATERELKQMEHQVEEEVEVRTVLRPCLHMDVAPVNA
jgi:hypothetical protein